MHINNAPVLTHWLIVSKIMRIKCISHLRGNWIPTNIQRRLSKYYDCIVSISQSVTNHAKEMGLSTDNLVTIYDGIDVEKVLESLTENRMVIKKRLNLEAVNSTIIGVVGNIKKWKGQHVAIEATKILKERGEDIVCLIVGNVSSLQEDKEYYDYLMGLVKNYGLKNQVRFTGYRKDVSNILSIMDILVHTSTQPEPLGRVVFEGMIFKKPVVATNHGGPAEIINNGLNGYLTPPGDAVSLADRIEYIIHNCTEVSGIGEKAIERVKEIFNIAKNVKEIEGVYDTVLARVAH